ncbi:MAG: GtrA family protein [Candidatus Fibromonas sp.]|nr:GtrA family protein [Candidatus Fibromonas sp.]
MLKSLFKSVFVYGLLVSVPATVVDWGIFFFCRKILLWHYILANSISFICGSTVNTMLSRKIAFTSKGYSKEKEITFLYIACIIGFLLSQGFMALFVEIMNLHPTIAKIITTFVVFAANYGMRQFFIFDSKPRWK